MTTLSPLSPQAVAQKLQTGAITLIDVREADEFAREHVPGARSIPLSSLQDAHVALDPTGAVVFHCRSGMRTAANCARLSSLVAGPAYVMDGGLDAWKAAKLPVAANARAPLELNRQVQIAIGASVVAGAALAAFVDPAFLIIPAFFGAGLLFAGLSGWCGLAKLLALAPWNRSPAS